VPACQVCWRNSRYSLARRQTIVQLRDPAGGIGLNLGNEIQQAEWPRLAFLIIMILITAGAIEWVSSRLRFAIIGKSRLAKQAHGRVPERDRRVMSLCLQK
jgi:hypothetical protein